MSNSPLVCYTKLSPNHSGKRNHKIDRITPHCVVGQCSVETLGNIFAPTSRQASCNYGIGPDGRIGMYCEEGNRSWCSSSASNDHRAVTVEVASDTKHPYAMRKAAYDSLIELCVDICKRNGIKKLLWLGGKEETLSYEPKNGEAVLTAHRWFANKPCPGDWLYSRYGELAKSVTSKLGGGASEKHDILYRVQTGAFKNPKNAEALLDKVKKVGFDAYMVQVDGLYKVQVGAFSKQPNATAMAKKLESAGFDAFITTKSGKSVSGPKKKTVDQVAHEVLQGLWGNSAERKARLTKAGYDYSAVQKRVNELL